MKVSTEVSASAATEFANGPGCQANSPKSRASRTPPRVRLRHYHSPYSPDLNPIEQVFAKLKTLLRKAAERTVEATWKRIGTLLTTFKPEEYANYLRNSGHASN